MRREEHFYVTDGCSNYADCFSIEEANAEIERLKKNDEECRKFWLNKGGIPSDVKIPNGYYITKNKFD